MIRTATVMLLTAAPFPMQAQQDSSSVTGLAPVIVTVTRGSGRTVLGSPFAITIVEPDSSRPGQRKVSLDESVALIPGVTSASRNNPSQDPRFSIRGFGARSAFGVRGVRVLRDGIPITLPDGQTPLDYISLESVGRIEVLRGAASALYGNASGGVVDLRSSTPSSSPADVGVRQWVGSSSTSRSVLSASGTPGRISYIGDLSYSRSDGSRDHSRQRSTLGFARVAAHAAGTEYALSLMGLSNPLAENPGALTLDEMRADRSMADLQSIRRDAKKRVTQFQLAGSANRITPKSELTLLGFGGARSLDNPLTFAVVEVGRHTWGATGTAKARNTVFGMPTSFTAGFDLQLQNDLRRNFTACSDTIPITSPTATCPVPGDERGSVTLDQRELVSSAGAYVSDEISITPAVSLTGALRADRIRFEVKDRLISNDNPDDSGDRTLSAISPVAGIVVRPALTHSLYANISSAFETPTATELGNQEDGSAGINPELDPQHSVTVEAGAKGWVSRFARYDFSVFNTRVRDELIPFEIPASNGRRYFRNAGRTRRTGAEVGGEVTSGIVSLMLAYNYSRFRFSEYSVGGIDYSGNMIPGIPRHRLQSALRLDLQRLYIIGENETSGRVFADDANSFEVSGYSSSNVRAGTSVGAARYRASIVVGANNIFDRTYASSIAVNAARSRYFEPAQGRNVFVGVSVGFRAAHQHP